MLNAIGDKLLENMDKNLQHYVHDYPNKVKQFLVNLMGSEIDYDKLQNSLAIFNHLLHDRRLVTDEIALLYRSIFSEAPIASAAPSASAAFGPPAHVPLLSEEIIQRLMIYGRFTREAVMVALKQTNNNLAAAIDVLNAAANPFATPPCDGYINFERQISDTAEQPDKILKKMYGIDVTDATSLDIALNWADASHQCNSFYAASFREYVTNNEKQSYEDLVNESLAMDVVATKITIIQKREVPNDGWCFYRAVLTAAQRNPDVRKFAQAITYCVTKIFTNTEDAMKQSLNTRVNGIQSRITVAQLVKLISIPNLTEKNHPCVYPELDQCIGQAAAYILQKNIFIYDQLGNLVGKYRGTASTKLDDQIVLVNTGGNHFDIITSFNSQ